jgi:RNA polymerase sigma-70 factor (ECF subfamily)
VRRRHDDQAWRDFNDIYGPLVHRYCRLRGLQPSDAQDVTQIVLTNVSRAIADFQYDPARGRFRSWLGTIAYREIQRHRVKAERAVPGAGEGLGNAMIDRLDAEADSAWQEAFNAHLYQESKRRIREEFDDDTWRAFELTWEHDTAPKEVATTMARPIQWVYKAKYRVLQRLRSELAYLCEDVVIFQRG